MASDKKRFPANTTLDTTTFLNDKKINGELYAYLQGISDYELIDLDKKEYVTYVSKKKMPAQTKVCEILGIKSPKTYRAHLNYLIEQGYVIEEVDKYILPLVEDFYFLIPLKTLQYLNDNCKEHVIKVYIYLGEKNRLSLARGSCYEFTLEELGQHTGIKVKNNSRAYEVLNNALDLLSNSGLIDYVSFFDGQMQKKKLLWFGLEHKTKE